MSDTQEIPEDVTALVRKMVRGWAWLSITTEQFIVSVIMADRAARSAQPGVVVKPLEDTAVPAERALQSIKTAIGDAGK